MNTALEPEPSTSDLRYYDYESIRFLEQLFNTFIPVTELKVIIKNKKKLNDTHLFRIIDKTMCNPVLYNEREKISTWIFGGSDPESKINRLKGILLPESQDLPKNKRLYKKYYEKIKDGTSIADFKNEYVLHQLFIIGNKVKIELDNINEPGNVVKNPLFSLYPLTNPSLYQDARSTPTIDDKCTDGNASEIFDLITELNNEMMKYYRNTYSYNKLYDGINITKHIYKTYNGKNISSYILNGKAFLDKDNFLPIEEIKNINNFYNGIKCFNAESGTFTDANEEGNCASGLTQKSSLSPFLKIYQTKTLRIYVLKQMDILNLSKIQELQIITLNQK